MNLLTNALDALDTGEIGIDPPDPTDPTDPIDLTDPADSPDPTGPAESDPTGGGLIRVVCRYDPDKKQTVLQVIDNGPGIHPNLKKSLFELFHSTKGNRGTGLGLPVAKKIVEEHGGSMDVQSEPGQGTTFTMTLPAFVEQVDDPSHTHFGTAADGMG
jgi:signal transduction histidine kinase